MKAKTPPDKFDQTRFASFHLKTKQVREFEVELLRLVKTAFLHIPAVVSIPDYLLPSTIQVNKIHIV